jgi:choline kinase
VPVAGIPLVGHALLHARVSGCDEAIVVVGYDGQRVRDAVHSLACGLSIRFVESPDPTAPNGVSLLAAEGLATSEFFLQMVDHVFAEPALTKLVETPLGLDEAGRVLVDRRPFDIDLADATKVRLAGVRVTAIGKGLDSWGAIDAGCFTLTPRIFAALHAVPTIEPRTVSSGMRQLVAAGLLGAVDLNGIAWADVDTPADRDAAELMLRSVGQTK